MNYDCINFISYASYSNPLGNRSIFLPKFKIPLALDIKNWGFQLKRAEGDHETRKWKKIWKIWPLTMALIVDRWPGGRPVRQGWEFQTPPAHFISPIFASRACRPFTSLLPEEFLARFRTDCRLRTWFWDGFGLGFWFETQGFTSWGRFLFAPLVSGLFSSISRRLGFRVCGCIFLSAFILCLNSFFTSFASLMAPRRETGTSRAQGKRPVKPSQPEQTEARRKARFDTAFFSSNEDY